MKKLWYFQHIESSCVWYEYMTGEEVDKLLDTNPVDLISEETYYKRIKEGFSYPGCNY